ncbi:hypothetical protein F4802DRAFT_568539 [Xylaria palmicola]|nr:hypothetical protein F4802DRAFT_568539 [Xylaria palmicola]
MPDSPGADGQTPDRPSFTGFWKGSKDKQAAQSLTFVTSKLGQQSAHGGGEGKTELSPAAKARERRQQVRRAQRQHRQRKANYTQQLEMDVTRLRDDIATVEQELKSLKSQNAAMRGRLPAPGRDPAVVVVVPPVPVPVAPPAEMAFSTLLAPEYTISLDVSANLGTPAYRVHRSSPSSLPDMSSGGGGSRATETPRRSATPASTAGTSVDDIAALEMTLSEAQVDAAINFILGYGLSRLANGIFFSLFPSLSAQAPFRHLIPAQLLSSSLWFMAGSAPCTKKNEEEDKILFTVEKARG